MFILFYVHASTRRRTSTDDDDDDDDDDDVIVYMFVVTWFLCNITTPRLVSSEQCCCYLYLTCISVTEVKVMGICAPDHICPVSVLYIRYDIIIIST